MNLRQARQKQGLTQAEMAEKLGVSRPTYIQIERGDKEPTVSQARIIAGLFELSGKKKTGTKKQNASKFEPQKFKELLLYVLERIGAKPDIGETALYKLLYFIDFDFYEKYGRSVSGATYKKNIRGPTPRQFKSIADEMSQAGELEQVKSRYFRYDQKKYLPHRRPDLDFFSAKEKEHIDDVLTRLSDKNASELSAYSHADVPWIATEDQADIDYSLVFQRSQPYAQTNADQMWIDASAGDILEYLGPMAEEEQLYYQNLKNR